MGKVELNVTLENSDAITNVFEKIGLFARECYDSQRGFAHIGKHVMETGHGSAIRSVSFQFRITGVSRALSHQLVRHKVGTDYNQRSQRYVSEDGFQYIIPPQIEQDPVARMMYIDGMEAMDTLYNAIKCRLIESAQEKGTYNPKNEEVYNQDARYVLPNACETRLMATFSLQALMHFFHERLCSRAQWEIRALAQEMAKVVLAKFPELYPYFVPKCKAFNGCPEGAKCCGIMPTKDDIMEGYWRYKELCK